MHDRVTRQTEKETEQNKNRVDSYPRYQQQATLAAHTNKKYQYITDFRAVRTVLNIEMSIPICAEQKMVQHLDF
jgi:hypothetical protein